MQSKPKNKELLPGMNGHYIMRKRLICKEDITILNVYASYKTASKYMKQKLTKLKGETDTSTVIVGVFSTFLSVINRTNREKISKDADDLSNTIHQSGLTDIYITLHLKQQYLKMVKKLKSSKVCSLTMIELEKKSITEKYP